MQNGASRADHQRRSATFLDAGTALIHQRACMYNGSWRSESRVRESQVACSQTGAMELRVATELFISVCDVLKEDESGRDCFSIAYLPVQCSKHKKKPPQHVVMYRQIFGFLVDLSSTPLYVSPRAREISVLLSRNAAFLTRPFTQKPARARSKNSLYDFILGFWDFLPTCGLR